MIVFLKIATNQRVLSGAGPPENDVRNCVHTNMEEKGIFRSLNQMEHFRVLVQLLYPSILFLFRWDFFKK